jgi:hypothetical protein
MLSFPTEWRFESPGRLSDQALREISDLIGKITANGNGWKILESFKSSFASAAGTTSSWSSSESWAQSDLEGYMQGAAENAPLFIQAFYDTCEQFLTWLSSTERWRRAMPDMRFSRPTWFLCLEIGESWSRFNKAFRSTSRRRV